MTASSVSTGPVILRSAWLPPGLCVLIVVLDAIRVNVHTYALDGLVDEPAHLATSALLLLFLRTFVGSRLSLSFAVGCLLAGNLIDADHLPQVLGFDGLTQGTPRPYTHSLVTPVALVLLGVLSRRWGRVSLGLFGAASGVLGHLGRDVATGHVSLLWPFDLHGFSCPYLPYIVILAVSAGWDVFSLRPRRRPRPGKGPTTTRTALR